MSRELIPYERQLLTFEESLLFGEATRRMDFARCREIVMTATIRSLSIPNWLITEAADTNYSSAILDSKASP